MKSYSQVVKLLAAIVMVSMVGALLCYPFFSYLPIIWSTGLSALLLLFVGARVALGHRAEIHLYLVILIVYTLVFCIAVNVFTGIERIERYECTYSIQSHEVVAIDLAPVGGFGVTTVISAQLIDTLTTRKPKTVAVDVSLVRDFGRIRARGMIGRVNDMNVVESDSTRPEVGKGVP